MHPDDPSQLPALHPLHYPTVIRDIVVDVIPHLSDPAVARGRVDHGASLGHAVAERLLHEYVLARLAGADGRERVPVVRRDHDDGVDVGLVQQLSEVAKRLRHPLSPLPDEGDRLLDVVGVHVADGADHPSLVMMKMGCRAKS